jgi:hypothetical protein
MLFWLLDGMLTPWVRVQGVGPNIAFKLDQLLPRLHKEIEKNKRTATTKTTTSRTAGHSTTRTPTSLQRTVCVCVVVRACVRFVFLNPHMTSTRGATYAERTREGDDAPAGPDENASESAHNAGQRLAASASREATERPDELPNKRPRSRAYTPRLRSSASLYLSLSLFPSVPPVLMPTSQFRTLW